MFKQSRIYGRSRERSILGECHFHVRKRTWENPLGPRGPRGTQSFTPGLVHGKRDDVVPPEQSVRFLVRMWDVVHQPFWSVDVCLVSGVELTMIRVPESTLPNLRIQLKQQKTLIWCTRAGADKW